MDPAQKTSNKIQKQGVIQANTTITLSQTVTMNIHYNNVHIHKRSFYQSKRPKRTGTLSV